MKGLYSVAFKAEKDTFSCSSNSLMVAVDLNSLHKVSWFWISLMSTFERQKQQISLSTLTFPLLVYFTSLKYVWISVSKNTWFDSKSWHRRISQVLCMFRLLPFLRLNSISLVLLPQLKDYNKIFDFVCSSILWKSSKVTKFREGGKLK